VVSIRAAAADADTLRAIAEWGANHCPVVDALRRSVPTEVIIDA